MKCLYKYVFICLLYIIFFSCGNNIPFLNESILKRPSGLTIMPLNNLSFEVRYFIQNSESTFDGYNLYISRNIITEGEIHTLPALSIDGGRPTFRHTPNSDPQQLITHQINHYIDGVTRFESGVTYFFVLVAHSRFNILSKPSNVIQSIAQN